MPSETLHTMGTASLILGIVELVVLVGYVAWLGLFSTSAAAGAVAVLLTGPMSFLFWGGVILIGLLIPLTLEVASVKGWGGVVGSVLTSTSLVLLGGFFLRLAILLSGQIM